MQLAVSAKSLLNSGFLVELLLRDMQVSVVGVIGHALLLSRCRRGDNEFTMKKQRVLKLLLPLLLLLLLVLLVRELGHCLVVHTCTRTRVVHEPSLAVRV